MSVLLADPGQSDIERRLERLSRDKVVVFAVREALRAAPLIGAAGAQDAIERLARPSFRAILTGCVAAFEPEARAAAKAASDAAFATASRSDKANSALYAAARAGAAAVASHAAGAAYAGYGAACCSARAAAARTTILDEAARDLERLEAEISAEQLRATPLWPSGAPAEFIRAAQRLSDALRGRGRNAGTWVDWYLSKMDGWPELLPSEREWVAARC